MNILPPQQWIFHGQISKLFPFYLFNFHGGICGRGAFSINVLCAYFLCAAIYSVYFYSLTCLSPLSTVEKDYRYLDKHKNEQIPIEGKTNTHKQTHTYPLQYNLAVQPPILGRTDVKCIVLCYQAGLSTAGSRLFVCPPTAPLAQAGGQTDGGSAGSWAEKNAWKLLLHQRRASNLRWEAHTHKWEHTQDPHLFTLFRFNVKLPENSGSCCNFFLVGLSVWGVWFYCRWCSFCLSVHLRQLPFIQTVHYLPSNKRQTNKVIN